MAGNIDLRTVGMFGTVTKKEVVLSKTIEDIAEEAKDIQEKLREDLKDAEQTKDEIHVVKNEVDQVKTETESIKNDTNQIKADTEALKNEAQAAATNAANSDKDVTIALTAVNKVKQDVEILKQGTADIQNDTNNIKNDTNAIKNATKDIQDATQAISDHVDAVRNKYEHMTASATTIRPDDGAKASYDPNTNVMHFDIPRGQPGAIENLGTVKTGTPTAGDYALFADPQTGIVEKATIAEFTKQFPQGIRYRGYWNPTTNVVSDNEGLVHSIVKGVAPAVGSGENPNGVSFHVSVDGTFDVGNGNEKFFQGEAISWSGTTWHKIDTISVADVNGQTGHVSITPANLGVYTKSESDSRFVNATGDTMTGELIVNRVGNNTSSSLGTDGASFSGYGIMGKRASFYITNSQPDGHVKISAGGAHGANVALDVSSSGITHLMTQHDTQANGNTYSSERLPNYASGTKTKLRRFRGGHDDTIWHETVQRGAWRLATGSNDDREVIRVSDENGGEIYVKGKYKVYHTGNKPTAGDVGAVAKSGDTMSGDLNFNEARGVSDTSKNHLLTWVNTNFYSGNAVYTLNLRSKTEPVLTIGSHTYSLYHTGHKPSKADVGLSNVPNWSPSDSVTTTTSHFATSKAVKSAYDHATSMDTSLTWSSGVGNDANSYNHDNHVGFSYGSKGHTPYSGTLMHFASKKGYGTQFSTDYGAGNRIAFRTYNGDKTSWNDWHTIYTTAYKPSAADVGALPASGKAVDSSKLNGTASYIKYDFTGNSDYAAITAPKSTWIRTPTSGILPNLNGKSSLGSSSWKFSTAYVNNMYAGHVYTPIVSFTGSKISLTASDAKGGIQIGNSTTGIGKTTYIGSRNSSWSHFETNATNGFYFYNHVEIGNSIKAGTAAFSSLTVNGKPITGVPSVSPSRDAFEKNFPVGHTVLVDQPNTSSSVEIGASLYITPSRIDRHNIIYHTSQSGDPARLAGTWVNRGSASSKEARLYQRIA